MQPHADEQRGIRACALTARGSTSKAMKALVGGAAQGSPDCRKNWTTALIPQSSGCSAHPRVWDALRGRHKAARSAMKCNVKLSPMSAPGQTGER